jgi:hypothetical protein
LDASPYSTSTEKTAPSCTPSAAANHRKIAGVGDTARGGFVGRKGKQVVAPGRDKRLAVGGDKC